MNLAGIREIAAILDVSPQRAHQLAATKGFPKPLDHLRSGPVWKRTDVEKWARARRSARSS